VRVNSNDADIPGFVSPSLDIVELLEFFAAEGFDAIIVQSAEGFVATDTTIPPISESFAARGISRGFGLTILLVATRSGVMRQT
jgi:hypothetical protein